MLSAALLDVRAMFHVGASGRDTRGIYRVHQFSKVEMFVVSAPEVRTRACVA